MINKGEGGGEERKESGDERWGWELGRMRKFERKEKYKTGGRKKKCLEGGREEA